MHNVSTISKHWVGLQLYAVVYLEKPLSNGLVGHLHLGDLPHNTAGCSLEVSQSLPILRTQVFGE